MLPLPPTAHPEFVKILSSQEKDFYRRLMTNKNRVFAIHLVKTLHAQIDQLVENIKQRPDIHFDCKPKCHYCCTLRVEASAPEVFVVAQELQKLPQDSLSSIISRLESHAKKVKGVKASNYFFECPFLVADLCSIYPVRPQTCRKFYSVDIRGCEKQNAHFPEHPELVAKANAYLHGTAQAYARAKLPHRFHELGQAVLLALTDATSEQRWFRREEVFEPILEDQRYGL